ncbi:hypothetical protein BGZ73_002024 [Actinomortierella ambigua]|nr:hypothetical protein BGZ73_002024 [Actinomortierella ambigua]
MTCQILSRVGFSGFSDDPDAETVAPMSDQVIAIVLTNDDDDNDVGTYFPPAKITPPLQRQLLQVDTRLLGNEWKLQLKSTYEFTGEARWESTQGYQQQPSWRLQARMARIMDGVDLYTYIRSVHLMRQFVTSNIR